MSLTAFRVVVAAAAAAVALPVTACGPDDAADNGQHISAPSWASGRPTGSPKSGTTPGQEADMRIQITVGDQRFSATLATSAATRDLVDQLPVTIEMTDHGGVEKTGRLAAPLSLDGQPAGADPDVGHGGYYARGNDLVLYYGDQFYYDGIVLLGRLDGDAAERIAAFDGSVSVTVATLGDPSTQPATGAS
jgi:hypothetical protein